MFLCLQNENDVFEVLGSPSIKISDVDHVWIYLISVKEEKVLEKDKETEKNSV